MDVQLERALQIVEAMGPCEICGMPPAVSVVGSVTISSGETRAIALCMGCAAREEEIVREKVL